MGSGVSIDVLPVVWKTTIPIPVFNGGFTLGNDYWQSEDTNAILAFLGFAGNTAGFCPRSPAPRIGMRISNLSLPLPVSGRPAPAEALCHGEGGLRG